MDLSQCIEQDGENANGQQEEEFDLQQAAECGRLDVDEEAAQYYAYQNGQSYNQYNNQNQQNVENQSQNQNLINIHYLILFYVGHIDRFLCCYNVRWHTRTNK